MNSQFESYDQLWFIDKLKSESISQLYRPHCFHYYSVAFHQFISGIDFSVLDEVKLLVARDGSIAIRNFISRHSGTLNQTLFKKIALNFQFYDQIPSPLRKEFKYYQIVQAERLDKSDTCLVIFPFLKGKFSTFELKQVTEKIRYGRYKKLNVLFTESGLQQARGTNKLQKNKILKLLSELPLKSISQIQAADLYDSFSPLEKNDYFYARDISEYVADCFVAYVLNRRGCRNIDRSVVSPNKSLIEIKRAKLSFRHEIIIYKNS